MKKEGTVGGGTVRRNFRDKQIPAVSLYDMFDKMRHFRCAL